MSTHPSNFSISKIVVFSLSLIIICFFSGTISAQGGYCRLSGKNFEKFWISGVRVHPFENLSDSSAYSDFTQQTIKISACGTAQVDLTPGFQHGNRRVFFQIWIDYNGDGDFSDAGENAFSDSSTGPITATFDTHITKMDTRMRIAVSSYPLSNSCGTFDQGEVEDYSIRATPPPPVVYGIQKSVSGKGFIYTDPDREYFNPCALVTLTATGDSGWMFDHWSGDLTGEENPVVINMKSDMKITAHFVEGSSPGQPSCIGYCGGQSKETGCWCDSNCERYGDCCPDKIKVCGAN